MTLTISRPCEPESRTVSADGIPMSGLVAEAANPRAVIAALHGGATNSAYYDSRAHAAHNLSVGWTALSYHLKVLSFAEECAIARERATAGPNDPLATPNPLSGG